MHIKLPKMTKAEIINTLIIGMIFLIAAIILNGIAINSYIKYGNIVVFGDCTINSTTIEDSFKNLNITYHFIADEYDFNKSILFPCETDCTRFARMNIPGLLKVCHYYPTYDILRIVDFSEITLQIGMSISGILMLIIGIVYVTLLTIHYRQK